MKITGLEAPGPPITVVLAGEDVPIAESLPPWVSGFARGRESLVVLFPARIPSYPDATLEGVLLHEVAHVLISRAAARQAVPRWLDEGLAMIAGSPWDLGDRSRVTLALTEGRAPSLASLERSFQTGGGREVRAAYALAGAFTHDLLRRHGSDTAAQILFQIAAGLPFDAAFERAVGTSRAAAEKEFWRRYTFWYRWIPLLTSSATLWAGITLLSLLAIRRRRQRDREMRERWAFEEARAVRPDNDRVN